MGVEAALDATWTSIPHPVLVVDRLSPDNSRFATVVASAARRDGQLVLRLTCAGHPAPLIVRSDGTVERADTRNRLTAVDGHTAGRYTA